MKVSMKVTYSQDSLRDRRGEPYKTNDKIYVWVKNESVLDNLINRRNRPVDEYKNKVIPVAMEILKNSYPEVYEVVKNNKWKFSQKCGCTCSCSPGFVGESKNNISIHVEI
jgi:hypothetical protein